MRKLLAICIALILASGDSYARIITPNPTGSAADVVCFGGRVAGNTVKSSSEACIDANGNLVPTTLNNQTVGQSTFPFSSLWIGTGTNNGTGLVSTTPPGVQLGTPAGVYVGTAIVSSSATGPILSLAGRAFTSVRAGTAGPAIFSNSCGGTAGGGNVTSALVTGSDFAGIVTLGTGNNKACTIAFGDPYLNTPICSITIMTSAGFVGIDYSGNPIILPTSIQFNTSLSSPATINYICVGLQQ